MINTYNESDLHLTLKKMYALEFNGKTEVRLEGTEWICDIIDENGNAIEIQTSNLSALTEKAEFILKSGKKLKIVHPVLAEKYIEMLDSAGNTLYRKKSQKKATIYDSLRGMTKICPLFLNENCTLEVLFVRATEFRRRTAEEVQTANKSRRHLKNWIPAGKKLEEILDKKRFSTKKDFTDLLCGAENAGNAEDSGKSRNNKNASENIKHAEDKNDAGKSGKSRNKKDDKNAKNTGNAEDSESAGKSGNAGNEKNVKNVGGAKNENNAGKIGKVSATKNGLFRACDISRAIRAKSGAKDARWANLLAWILLKMNLIEVRETKGRSKYYGICDDG